MKPDYLTNRIIVNHECPFCGSDNLGIAREDEYVQWECRECGCLGPVSENINGAVKLWVERSVPPQIISWATDLQVISITQEKRR